MATSCSSDESSTAPRDFHVSSSLDSGSRFGLSKTKCSLCSNFRKVFYCKDCVHSGSFYHSKHQSFESYLDKRRALSELEECKKTIEKKCLKSFEARQKADALRSKIRQYRDRNRLVRLAVEEKRQKKDKCHADLKKLQENIRIASEKLLKYDQKVAQIEHCVAGKKEVVEKHQKLLEQKKREIIRLVRMRIEQLRYVFPITKVEPILEVLESDESEMVNALAEASQTMYIRDRWEYADLTMDSTELHYRIVEPTLPGSGNYTLYNLWVAKTKDAVPANLSPDAIEHSPAYNISAALTYTAQLIHVLAFYFNVRLPFRMVYSDFCGGSMDDSQFARRVARLNANILHLCLSQNIDLANLRAAESMQNILRVLDTNNPHMGRDGPFAVDARRAEAVERALADDLDLRGGENTDSDEGDSFHREWETVPHIPVQDVPAMSQHPAAAAAAQAQAQAQASQMMATQQAASMAGGLVTSAATAAANIVSLWRGFTGR